MCMFRFLCLQEADVATCMLMVAGTLGHTEFARLMLPFVPNVDTAVVRAVFDR
jgi:hypothetical protein